MKVVTEALAHELRNTPNCRVTPAPVDPRLHLHRNDGGFAHEKPPGAWTGDQVVEFLIATMETGEFYALCPDNDVNRDTDERRMLWTIGDIVENRPALSRWHPDYKDAFERFMKAPR